MESLHESGLFLVVLRRPLRVPVKLGFRARQHQNVFHIIFLLFDFGPGLAPFHGVVGSNPRFSTSLKVFLLLLQGECSSLGEMKEKETLTLWKGLKTKQILRLAD